MWSPGIVIFLIIVASFFFFRKKPSNGPTSLLSPFEFSTKDKVPQTFHEISFENPLNIVFILIVIQGLFFRVLPLIFEMFELAEDYQLLSKSYSIVGIVFTFLFLILSFSINSKMLKTIVILYFLFSAIASIYQLSTNSI